MYANRQEYYRDKYRRLKPQWKVSADIYRDIIDRYADNGMYILDVGCGHSEDLEPVYAKTNYTYGIDPDRRSIEKNRIIKNKFIASANELPFEDNFFDLVVSSWVLEHLENPKKVFDEIYRVLKPGGKVIFLTPNTWSYNVWLIRMIPNRLHGIFTRKLYNRHEVETYPVFYRINSPRKFDKLFSSIGYEKIDVIFNGDPSYISFNDVSFYFACALEEIFDKFFTFAKVHAIGVFQKPIRLTEEL